MLDTLAFLKTNLSAAKLLTGVLTGTAFSVLFGTNYMLLLALFILFFIDTVTGVAAAVINKEFQSHNMRKGIIKFLAYTLSIVVAAQFSQVTILFWLTDAILAFLALTELSSIGENLKKLGFYFPSFSELRQVVSKTSKEDSWDKNTPRQKKPK